MKAIIGKLTSGIHKLLIVAVVLLFLLYLIGCEKSNDKPPRIEGPEPKAHNGAFISTNAKFTFDGDKEKVFVEFVESGTSLDFSLEGNTTADRIVISYVVPGDKNLIFIKQ